MGSATSFIMSPNGLLGPQGSVAELITVLDRFMSEPFIHERIEKIYQQVSVFFDPDNIHPYHNLFIEKALILRLLAFQFLAP